MRRLAIQRARRQPEHPRLSWAARNHLTDSPNLWDELASLRGEAGAQPPGAWIDRSLQGHIERTSADLDRPPRGDGASALVAG